MSEDQIFSAGGITGTPQRAAYVNELEQYEEEARRLISEEGIYSEKLVDNYLAMANLYYRNRQLDQASAAYTDALQVIRIVNGIDTEQQLPVLKANADVLMKQGNISEAEEELEKIRSLRKEMAQGNEDLQTNYDLKDAEDLQALAEYAWYHRTIPAEDIVLLLNDAKLRFNNSATYLSQDLTNNEEALVNVYKQIARTNYLLEKIVVDENIDGFVINDVFFFFNQDSRNYLRRPMIDALPTYKSLSSGEHVDISPYYQSLLEENPFIVLSFARDEILPPYLEGLNLLYYVLNEKLQDEEGPESIFTSMMDVADWSLILGSNYSREARNIYEEAYNLIQDSDLGNKDELIDEYFNSELPQQIPTFVPAEYSLEGYGASASDPRTTLGFIDISFRLDRNGHAKRVKVLSKSPELDSKYEDMLLDDLKSNQYRPAFEGSKPVRKDYSLRYYVSTLD